MVIFNYEKKILFFEISIIYCLLIEKKILIVFFLQTKIKILYILKES